MNYRLSFSPNFFRNKQELLKCRTPPCFDLPKELEACFKLETSAYPRNGRLWFACLKAIRSFLIQSFVASFGAALCAVVATIAAMEILKAKQNTGILIALAFVYFVSSICGQIGIYFNNIFRNFANHTSQAFLGQLISRKILQLSFRSMEKQRSGNLKVLMTADTHHIAEFLDNVIRNFIPAIAALVGVFPVLVWFTGKAGLTGVLIMVVFLPISIALNQISIRVQKRGQVALDALVSLLNEWIRNIRLIRCLSWGPIMERQVLQKLRKYMSFSSVQHGLACFIFGFAVSWWMVAVLGVLWVAKWLGNSLDLLSFFGSLWLITFLAGNFVHLSHTIRLFGLAVPSMARIAAFLGEQEQQDLLDSSAVVEEGFKSKIPTHIIFEAVSFSYSDRSAPWVIRNLSIRLALDRKTALVGQVGSGKSTFLRLLCGEVRPTEGQICVEFQDGTRRNLWDKACYELFRSHLAWVPQQPFVSCDFLAQNISLISNADESSIIEAAYWAELEADVKAFPSGIYEDLGEAGVNLSGGQKQRLNMARAYYSNRSYLVLDDSLSAVDGQTELALMQRLEKHRQGFFLVTHRTAELMRVQEVLVMHEGALIERGAPGDLAADANTQFSRILHVYESERDHG